MEETLTKRSLVELYRAYRRGDPAAEAELIEQLGMRLQGKVRGMMGPRIRWDRDSIDVTQSVILAFHLNASQGKISVDSEEALDAYLRTMVRNKLANLSDRQKAAKRGAGRRPVRLEAEEGEGESPDVPSLDPTASTVVSLGEIVGRMERFLDPEEAEILRERLDGRTNREIGEALEKSADAVRMLWNRAREKLLQHGLLKEFET